MKKCFLFLLLATWLPVALLAQNTAQPTMDQLIGVNCNAKTSWKFLKKFGYVREYHDWALDTGFDETDCGADNDPNPVPPGACPVPWQQNLNANCPVAKRYGWNPSYDASAYLLYDEFYSTLSRKVVPSLKGIAPEFRGVNNYPLGFLQILEEKPLCLNSAYTFTSGTPPPKAAYPNYIADQLSPVKYLEYASWVSLFAFRFCDIGFPSLPDNDPLVQYYRTRLLGGVSAFYDCDFCHRHIESSGFNRKDVRYLELWNEGDQTWDTEADEHISTDEIPPTTPIEGFTRKFFYPAQYAALLSAVFDGHNKAAAFKLSDNPSRYLGVRNVGGKTAVVFGGLAGLRGDYVVKTMNSCSAIRPTAAVKLPFNVFNFHHYSSSSSQSIDIERTNHNIIQFAGGSGVHPEQTNEQLKNRLNALKDQIFGGAPSGTAGEVASKEFWLSEFGYDSGGQASESGVDVPALTGADRQKVQAQWLMRSFLEISAATANTRYFHKAMAFTIQDAVKKNSPNAYQFATAGLIDGSSTYKRSWFYVQTLRNVLTNYKFFSEIASDIEITITPPTGQPTPKIYRYKNAGIDQDIYAIWSPTAGGTANSYNATVQFKTNVTPKPATLTQVVEMDENGKRTHSFPAGSQITIPVSETPVFLRMNSTGTDATVNPVTGLSATPLCCGIVELNWTPGGIYKSYAIYYAKKSDLIAPVLIGGVLKFPTFYQDVFPNLLLFADQIPVTSKYLVSGLENGVDYWFFVIPYDVNGNHPELEPAEKGKHFIDGTPMSCTVSPGNFCIYPTTINNIVYPSTTCPNAYDQIKHMFGIYDAAGSDGCSRVNAVPTDEGWIYADGQLAVCKTVTIDFQSGGGAAQIVRALYVRSQGSQGRLKVEVLMCGCPTWMLLADLILPYAGSSALFTIGGLGNSLMIAYPNYLPLEPIRKIRFTRLDNQTKVQRIFFCSKDAQCLLSSALPEPSAPTNLQPENITPWSALLTWNQARMNQSDPISAPFGAYAVEYSTSLSEQGELLNPIELIMGAEVDAETQAYRLRDLEPLTTYHARVSNRYDKENAVPPCGGLLKKSGVATFTTTSEETEDRSSSNSKATQARATTKKLRIAPNPNNGDFTALFPGTGYERLEVYDLSGRLITKEDVPSNVSEYRMENVQLLPGTYLIRALGVAGVASALMVVGKQ